VIGAIFYYSFADLAVGQYVRQDAQALEKIKAGFANVGVSNQAWETNWACPEMTEAGAQARGWHQ